MERVNNTHSGNVFALWLKIICLLLMVVVFYPVPARATDYLKVAILKEPKNLNPFQASDAWTKKVIQLIYQPLYLVDTDTQTLTPWLAKDLPVYDADNMIITFHLREMKWDDGSDFSADDVVFTGEILKKFHIPRYYAYWEFVEKIVALDKTTVRITLKKPMAVFPRRTLSTWIVQKKKWEPLIRDAEKKLTESGGIQGTEATALLEASKIIETHKVEEPTGLGPFKFASRKKGNYILLVKNDHFFGQGMTISGRTLGPYIDGVMFKIFEALPAATLALQEGQIDFLWKGISQSFVKDLVPNPDISVPMTLEQGYRYLGFNLRKYPMSDPAFRHAVAYLINKNFIVKRILHDHGQRLDTFVPPSNTFYYDSGTPIYGEGMGRKQRTRKPLIFSLPPDIAGRSPHWTRTDLCRKGRALKGLTTSLCPT